MIGAMLAICLSCAPEHAAAKASRSPTQRQTPQLSGAFSIQPSAASVTQGDSILLVATFERDSSQRTAQTVAWKSSNTSIATVSASGLVTAIAPGLAGISAHRDGKIAVARIVVTSSGPAASDLGSVKSVPRDTSRPKSSSPGASTDNSRLRLSEHGGANEPGGFRRISSRPFNSKAARKNDITNAEGWRADAEFRDRGLSIIDDRTAPVSPPSVAQIRYEKGMVGGIAPAGMNVPLPEKPRSVYVKTAMKLSSNFYGHPASGVNKLNFFYLANNTASAYFSAQGQGNGALTPQLRLQSINTRPSARNLTPNVRRGAKLARGVWHKLEFLLIVNTPGYPNGEAHVWLNGDKIIDYRDINYIAVGETAFDAISVTSIWGGGPNVRVPHDMYAWWDHVYVSTR
ncbi:MAG: Ig-like domain-containing protein [Anaerolineae bacterium]|nr:Ig-like domain-containing protein [Gemmatimonadaceae bacterium]